LLATYTYNSNNGKLVSMKYGNDTIPVTYQYDALDRLKRVCCNIEGKLSEYVRYNLDDRGICLSLKNGKFLKNIRFKK